MPLRFASRTQTGSGPSRRSAPPTSRARQYTRPGLILQGRGGDAVTDDSAARDITTLRLPGIGWLLQWRSDGFWRELNESQHYAELNGSHVPTEDEWARWSGLAQPHARGGEWGGIATWWLVYGERPGSTTPSVVLADGTRPSLLLLGRLWACEWHAVAQSATVWLTPRPSSSAGRACHARRSSELLRRRQLSAPRPMEETPTSARSSGTPRLHRPAPAWTLGC